MTNTLYETEIINLVDIHCLGIAHHTVEDGPLLEMRIGGTGFPYLQCPQRCGIAIVSAEEANLNSVWSTNIETILSALSFTCIADHHEWMNGDDTMSLREDGSSLRCNGRGCPVEVRVTLKEIP